VLSAVGLAVFHHVLYGFLDPGRVYGSSPDFSLSYVPRGILGLLFDQEFGLLPYAPLFALAARGLPALWRTGWRQASAAWALVGVTVGTAAAWHMWRGGFNPPARFLVPVIPVLALGVAAALSSRRRVGAALLIGWGLWIGAAGMLEPQLVHRDRDSTAPFFRTLSGAQEWTTLLPGYVVPATEWAYDRPYADRYALTALWAIVLGLAVFGPRRPASDTGRLLLATIAALAATGIAAGVSTGSSQGRDAVRLVGRPGIEVFGLERIHHARWGPADLLSGHRAYTPDRVKDGLALGARLPLSPGRFHLAVETRARSGGTPPRLEVRPERGASRPRVTPMRGANGAFEAEFKVLEGERAVKLGIRGGSAFEIEEIRLSRYAIPTRLH
jgi:hypothetical protein